MFLKVFLLAQAMILTITLNQSGSQIANIFKSLKQTFVEKKFSFVRRTEEKKF